MAISSQGNVGRALASALTGSISEITQRSMFRRLGDLAESSVDRLTEAERRRALTEIEPSIRLFARSNSVELIAACAAALGLNGGLAKAPGPNAANAANAANWGSQRSAEVAPRSLAIESEKDIATARGDAWAEAVRLGLSKFKSVKVATAVSELARNIVFYAQRGTIEIQPLGGTPQRSPRLVIVARDQGPGIEPARLASAFAGTYRSERGMGKGLSAVKRLVDEFAIDTAPGRGTTVTCAFTGER